MSIFGHGRGFVLVAAGFALSTVMSLAPTANAQFGEAAGIGEAMQPDYYRRDIVLISQGLKLDETQRTILNTMFDDYTSEFEDGLAQMKKRFEDMREELQIRGDTDKAGVMKLVFAPFRDWSEEKAEIGTQFLANIEVVLSDEQLQLWPGVQRRLYRERHLHKGRLSGENVNLLDIIRDMHLDQRTNIQVQPIVEAYEIALDRALRQREEPLTGKNNAMLQSLEDQDSQKGHDALRQHIERQVAVRNVNDEYTEQIAMSLPADLSHRFRSSALERAYPRIYRETPVQRIFGLARELEGLDAGVRGTVIMLEAELLSELAVMNANLLQALRSWEPVESLERAGDFAKRMEGMQVEPKQDPTRSQFAKREEMFRGYVNRLKAMLTTEQFDKLPGAYRWVEVPQTEQTPAVKQTGSRDKNAAKEAESMEPRRQRDK